MVYSHSELAASQKASNHTKVTIWETHFLEFVQEALVPNTVESLRYIKKDADRLFALAAGLCHVFHHSTIPMMSGWVRLTEAELLGYQHVQSFEMVSQPRLYETLEDFQCGGQEADGPEFVRLRRILTRLR